MVRILIVIIIVIAAIIAVMIFLHGTSMSRPAWYQKQLDDEQMDVISGKNSDEATQNASFPVNFIDSGGASKEKTDSGANLTKKYALKNST